MHDLRAGEERVGRDDLHAVDALEDGGEETEFLDEEDLEDSVLETNALL